MEEDEMISLLALLIGLAVLAGGIYFLIREKGDPESRKIYLITTLAGVVIFAGAAVKMAVLGL